MDIKISNFFNSEKLRNKKEITTDELLALLSSLGIATNSADAYYFIRICKGSGVLKQTKPKTFTINREILKKEVD